jgi:hypothetical protein
VIAAAKPDETAVAVIEMEVSSEVCWVGFTVEPAVLRPLLIRQKPDRHQRFPSAQNCKGRNFCAVGINSCFAGDFGLQKSLAKVHSFARTFGAPG